MANKKKILQIIPAADWFAVFKVAGEQDAAAPLACWALVEYEDGSTRVEGLEVSGEVEFAEDQANFGGYVHGSEVEDEG